MTKAIIFILICVLGFAVAYSYGMRWVDCYEMLTQMRIDKNGDWEVYRIVIQPRQIGAFYTHTLLEKRADGYWYLKLKGIGEMKFKEISG